MRNLLITITFAFLLLTALTDGFRAIAQVASDVAPEQTALFSGPQVGETLPPLVVRGAFDAVAGKEIDPVTEAGQSPIVLIFIHDVNRLAISFARTVSDYASSRSGEGLASAVILLDDDATTAEATLKRIRHALNDKVTHAVSIDGREGPGSYGLNRNVTLTILVAKDGKVTANHAIVQPSLTVDFPKVVKDIVDVAGGPMPNIERLLQPDTMRGENQRAKRVGNQPPDMRPLLAPLIRKTATDEQVDAAAAIVEQRLKEDEAIKKEVARISKTIVNSDKLENYGTPRTQYYLKKWAKEFGEASDAKNDQAPRQ